MPKEKDYYDIFGITRDASIEEIEIAYQNLINLCLSKHQYRKDKKMRGKRRKLKQIIKAHIYITKDKLDQLRSGTIHKEELEQFKTMVLSLYGNIGLDVNLSSFDMGYVNPNYFYNLDNILTFGYFLMKSDIDRDKGHTKVRK
jgi:hypothetical protein